MNKRKNLLQKFIEFNENNRLANCKKKVLLAVSGGVDSVVMCHLFHESKFPFAIAHCNFQLRGKESNGDERFVKELAKKYGVEFFSKKFDTKTKSKQEKISVQLAARELRYEWFERLLNEKGFVLVATAHQLNDNIETIIYNITKGTGIRGLRGIPVRQVRFIRPLLFATRNEIEDYANKRELKFREDSSNADDKYVRNKIRHHVIPMLKEINPSLENTFAGKIELFTELEHFYERQIRKPVRQLFLQRGNDIYIPVLSLKKIKSPSSVLFEYLHQYEFSREQIEDILANVDAEPGKQFLSPKARIIKDRRFFILTKLSDKGFSYQVISEKDKRIKLDSGKVLNISSANSIKPDKTVAFIDKSKLEFPLIARHWKQGDYFYPFGMKMKKKKLKKFFNDEKVPLHQKENIWVIESNKKIVWVAGYRIDERYKVSDKTTDMLKLELKSSME